MNDFHALPLPVESWRDAWPPFRVSLVEETARCLADQQAKASGGLWPAWTDLSQDERSSQIDAIATLFFAQDLAMENLIARGEVL